MKIKMNEQEMIDSVALYGARNHRIPIDQVSIELFYDENRGFYSNLYPDRGATLTVNEQEIIDAVAIYLRDYHRFDPAKMEINLSFEEGAGFSADVDTNK